ncbi:hypothetical protein ACLG6S_07030 [Thermodesulfobacteriota bacterium B35]
MEQISPKILLLGSNVKITNLPIKEVSLLEEGSLPAYGYNPGDDIDLLAGRVSIENGRLEQCLTWLSIYLTGSELTPRLHSVAYGSEKQVFQIFRKRKGTAVEKPDHGWFMVNQILPSEGRGAESEPLVIDNSNLEAVRDNSGIVIIDDSGVPPQVCDDLADLNPASGVLPWAFRWPTGSSGRPGSATALPCSAASPTWRPPAWRWTAPSTGRPSSP